jgi:hypothetical protein
MNLAEEKSNGSINFLFFINKNAQKKLNEIFNFILIANGFMVFDNTLFIKQKAQTKIEWAS